MLRSMLCRPALAWAVILAFSSCVTLAVYANMQLPVSYTRKPPFGSLFMVLEACCVTLCIIEVLLRFWTRVSYQQLLAPSWMWVCGISILPLLLYTVRAVARSFNQAVASAWHPTQEHMYCSGFWKECSNFRSQRNTAAVHKPLVTCHTSHAGGYASVPAGACMFQTLQ